MWELTTVEKETFRSQDFAIQIQEQVQRWLAERAQRLNRYMHENVGPRNDCDICGRRLPPCQW